MDVIGLIQQFFDEIMPIMPQFILILAALIVPVFGFKSSRVPALFTLAAATLALAMTGYMLFDGYHQNFRGMFEFNAFSGLMTSVFLIVLILVTIISYTGCGSRRHRGEYFSLLMAATVGMMFVADSYNLITMFVGIELASISSYALVAIRKNDPKAAEAAVKYLIIGGISTALSLYGMSMIYGLTGSVMLSDIAAHMSTAALTWPYMVAIITLIAGFGFKIAIVPFHSWAPDVYDGASTPVTTFLAVGSKKMGFIVFFKVFLMMFIAATLTGGIPEVQWIFAILAAVTMTVGNIVAISQTSIKRMLAYSSIAQAGYILIVLAVSTPYALEGGLFHMITHVFMKGGAFIVVAALAARGLGENISDYKGLSKRAPLTAFAMMLFLFSLAGIPPLAGFASKFILFSSAITPAGTWIWLVALAVINSAISLYYYARVVKAMYVDKGTTTERVKVPMSFAIAMAICAIATVAIGIYPMPILDLVEAAVKAFI